MITQMTSLPYASLWKPNCLIFVYIWIFNKELKINTANDHWRKNTNIVLVYMLNCFSCVQLCNPVDYSLPGSSDHGILQARTLEWVAISFSRESFWPKDQTHISYVSYIGRQVLYHKYHLGGQYCAYHMPTTFQRLYINLWSSYHFSHFTFENAEATAGYINNQIHTENN